MIRQLSVTKLVHTIAIRGCPLLRRGVHIPSKVRKVSDSQLEVALARNREKHVSKILSKVNKKKKKDTIDHTSTESVLLLEIRSALKYYSEKNGLTVGVEDVVNPTSLINEYLFSRSRPTTIIESMDIIYQTNEGEGLGLIPKSLYAAPFIDQEEEIYNKFTLVKVPKTLPGDRVKVRLNMHHRYYSEGVLLEVLKSKNSRRDNLILCSNFNNCSGCQLQMLNYEDQLNFKQNSIRKAYKYFYPQLGEAIDDERFGMVNGSPIQYSYRSKLTPHYKIPRQDKDQTLNIGLNHVDASQGILDIDSCPIASPTINSRLKEQREKIFNELKYAKAGDKGRQRTLLLRDSVRINNDTGDFHRVCLTDSAKVVTEKVEDFVYQFNTSSFFQVNVDILPNVLDFMRYHIELSNYSFKYLIDTYCGVGFFGIGLSNAIKEDGKIFGIEVSAKSIEYATHNAKLNGIAVPERIQFISGSSETMFENEHFVQAEMQGSDSIVIMDPSRKGANESFMRQLLAFKPRLIFYVSCNVITQARDLAMFEEYQKASPIKYKIREVAGFDFFPQTKHVESIAVLELCEN
ncbi:RNA methyltransferase [Scheffersomyces coipomensis]|uniref:RNA methyltransferase n=1 Tax=Scheffersomyces coipomensis TaxID=1788519 RepID=UPI00315D90C2